MKSLYLTSSLAVLTRTVFACLILIYWRRILPGDLRTQKLELGSFFDRDCIIIVRKFTPWFWSWLGNFG